LTVTSATLTSLVVSPAVSDFEQGGSTQFTATADFSDGTTRDVTPWVIWTSSSANVAAVGPTGLATSSGAGTTTVMATMSGQSGKAVVTVH
jgi:hypothetical protein